MLHAYFESSRNKKEPSQVVTNWWTGTHEILYYTKLYNTLYYKLLHTLLKALYYLKSILRYHLDINHKSYCDSLVREYILPGLVLRLIKMHCFIYISSVTEKGDFVMLYLHSN